MKKYLFLFLFSFPFLAFAGTSYQQLYDQYFALNNALAHDSIPDAKKAAKELATTIALMQEQQTKNQPITPEDLPKDKRETARQHLATLSLLSKTIHDVDKLDQMRKPFEEMTAILSGMRDYTKIQADDYYCPMVKKVWLQTKNSKEVTNPYMGKEMINCGEKKKAGK